ncbi:hypothetical protein Tco_0775513 [Tanacetum coccineum]
MPHTMNGSNKEVGGIEEYREKEGEKIGDKTHRLTSFLQQVMIIIHLVEWGSGEKRWNGDMVTMLSSGDFLISLELFFQMIA